MASVSQAYSHPESWEYSAPNPKRQVHSQAPSQVVDGVRTDYNVSLLLRRIRNMADCSEQSRKVLVVLRRRVSAALEQEELSPSTWHISKDSSMDYTAIVSCRNCEGFMVQPVCLPCGHSICKSCTEKSNVASNDSLTCPNCNQVCSKVPSSCFGGLVQGSPSARDQNEKYRASTVIIQNAFRRWYPDWVESCRYREEGNMYANKSDFACAVQYYSQALEKGVCDYRVLGNRSRAYLALGDLSSAGKDADLACQLRPFWAKGHYRRACVLQKQGRWCEALSAYFLCLNFGGNDQAVIKAACQLIDQIVSRSMSNDGVPASAKSDMPTTANCSGTPQLADVVNLAVEKMKECLVVSEEGKSRSAAVAPAMPELVERSEFECVLCTCLLYNPVTTSCGHSFCQVCLCRSFDHTPTCPICRTMLSETFKQHCQSIGKLSTDMMLEGLLLHYFRESYEAKQSQQKVDLQRKFRAGISETEYLPVFVCTMGFPTLPCPLHIFEPRYRLMIRRCMESGSRRFGMCPSSSEESFASYGTVLCINSVQSMDDGRCLISSTGERRFRVVGRGMIDGYHMAQIVFLFDERVTDQEEITILRNLQEEVYRSARRWLDDLPVMPKFLIIQTVSTPFPDMYSVPECCPNGPEWVWWLVHACPISPTRKLEFLKCTSLKVRLQMVKDLLKSSEFPATN